MYGTLKQGSKILVVNIGGVGDQVMAIPALQALHEAYPSGSISVLTIERGEYLVRELAFIKQVFKLKIKYKKIMSYVSWGVIRLLYSLRQERFDLAINLQGIFSFFGAYSIRLLFFSIGAAITAGRNTNNKGTFYTIAVPEKHIDPRHTVEIMIDIVKAVSGKDVPYSFPRFIPSREDKVFVDAFLEKIGIQRRLLIGLNPGSYLPSHRWDPERFAALTRMILKQYDAWIVFHCGPHEEHITMPVARQIEHRMILARSFTLGQLSALIKNLHLFISSDTGPMHIAAAVETPVIALFGPIDPGRFRPYTDPRLYTVIRHDVACERPCYLHSCRDMRCMNSISVEEVWEAVRKYLPA